MDKLLARLSKFWRDLAGGNMLRLLARHGDLVLPVALMVAIGLLFVSVPTPVVSFFVVLNLAASFIVLSTSLNIKTPLQLTSYPTILLLTTLVRLCLSVTVSAPSSRPSAASARAATSSSAS
jgi:type III secretion protein V